jgi:hypothetical protein
MKSGVMGTLFRNIVQYMVGAFFLMMLVSCGGGGGSPGTVAGSTGTSATTAASVSLLFSSIELPSSGATGTEVTVTALVKNANNNAIASAPVTFTATSGALTNVQAATDTNGRATALLSTSGERTNRTITITAKAGNITATGTVNVVGTTVSISGPGTITSGGMSDFTITVRDQAGATVAGVPVTLSSAKGNPIAVKLSGGGTATAPLTNAQGKVEVTVSGTQAGSDTLTASSQGSTFAHSFTVNTLSLSVTTPVSTTNIGSCTSISGRYENAGVGQNGTVNITASRGDLYSDATCLSSLGSSSVSISNGTFQTIYIKSSTVGIATITAAVQSGPTTTTSLEFVAPTPAKINLQADPAIVSPSGLGQSNASELTVVVRDASNNLVQGAAVEFTIVRDQSGGTLSNSVVTTERNGSAKVTFLAGAAATATDGVEIRARIQGTSVSHNTTLTVSRRSLFISAGTGNITETPTNTEYKKDFVVFVTDASGNPVSGVSIAASIRATRYDKGYYYFDSDPLTVASGWLRLVTDTCTNEDSNQNGILDTDLMEDFNGNGVLDPGAPFNVSSSGVTDATGTTTVSILYPRNRAGWTEVELTVRGSVTGTEATYKTVPFYLPLVASDLSTETVAPPGSPNPYGRNICSIRD